MCGYPDLASSISGPKNKADSREERRGDRCVGVRPGVPVFSVPPTNDLIHYGKGLTDMES